MLIMTTLKGIVNIEWIIVESIEWEQ
jgi:hypothetical protein